MEWNGMEWNGSEEQMEWTPIQMNGMNTRGSAWAGWQSIRATVGYQAAQVRTEGSGITTGGFALA